MTGQIVQLIVIYQFQFWLGALPLLLAVYMLKRMVFD